MDADDLLREAAIAAAEETLADPFIDPASEVERLKRMVESNYYGALEDLREFYDDKTEDDEDDEGVEFEDEGEG